MKNSLYFETSALLVWLFEQTHFEKILALVEQAPKIGVSILSILEAKRNVAKLEVAKQVLPAQRSKILATLENAIPNWDLMDLNSDIQRRVGEPFPIEPVRTLDAVHLAAALEFIKIYPDLKVLTLDQRIISNLEPLGLALAEI